MFLYDEEGASRGKHAIDMMPNELSGGMSRRTALARALAGQPDMILFDSPCSGLDPVIVRRILRVVMRLRDIERVTSLYVTQNMDEVKYLSSAYFGIVDGKPVFRRERGDFCLKTSRILMLSNGHIIFDQPDELFWTSEDAAIRQFLS
jgi:ABC-type transporter Mla maintaining outer membrane lipid asymmetry ATPase subunit MlaF